MKIRATGLVICILFLLLPLCGLIAQPFLSEVSPFDTVENLIIQNEYDSAHQLLSNELWENVRYRDDLLAIVNASENREQLYSLLYNIKRRSNLNYAQVDEFLQKKLTEPNQEKFDYDYIKLKWWQVSFLRDELLSLENCNIENEILLKYGQRFPENHKGRLRAEIMAMDQQFVISFVQRDYEGARSLIQEGLSKSLKTDSEDLRYMLTVHNAVAHLLINGDGKEYVNMLAEGLKGLKYQDNPPPFYVQTIVELIDGHERVKNLVTTQPERDSISDLQQSLLNQLFEIPSTEASVVPMFIKFTTWHIDEEDRLKWVLDKFNVSDIQELADLMQSYSERLNGQNPAWVQRELSNLLRKAGYWDQAFDMLGNSISSMRKAYGEDLSKSIAQYEKRKVEERKNIELMAEKEKAQLYVAIAILAILLTGVAAFTLARQLKLSKELKIKNESLSKQRDAIQKKDEEKALLLREVHHRVKNNFQIIMSLLDIQERQLKDSSEKPFSLEGKNRIKSMAFIHDRLYRKDELSIEFDEYLEDLIDEVSNSFPEGDRPKITLSVPQKFFDVDTAIPLGLIVNELLTNAFKYGFEKNNRELNIKLQSLNESMYQLDITDNGAGLQTNDLDKIKGTGLGLVQRLAKQLRGHLNYSNDHGSTFSVLFEETETE